MTKKILSIHNVLLVTLLFLMVHLLNKGVNAINTGDYYRVLFAMIDLSPNVFQQFSKDVTQSIKLKNEFSSLGAIDYPSTYTYLLYLFLSVVKVFSDSINVQTIFVLNEILYAVTLVVFYRMVAQTFFPDFAGQKMMMPLLFVCGIPLISRSNVGFSHSFYQESILLLCVPLILTFFVAPRRKHSLILSLIGLFCLSTSKSQFFYLPTVYCVVLLLMNIRNKKNVCVVVGVIQIIALSFVLSSSGATNLNQYHSSYYGVYVLEQSLDYEMPSDLKVACVGVDAWGNKYDLRKGAVREQSNVDLACFKNAVSGSTFKGTFLEYVKHPSLIFDTFFNKGLYEQFSRDYVHVYKEHVLFFGGQYPISKNIDLWKDAIFHGAFKIVFPIVGTLIIVLLLGKETIPLMLFLNLLFYSQIFVSFLGEGYRDLSKHLFSSNLASDYLMFILLLSFPIRLIRSQHNRDSVGFD